MPVLKAAVEWFDDPDSNIMNMPDIVELSGLAEDDVKRALRRISSAFPPYIDGVETAEAAYPIAISSVTERGHPRSRRLADTRTLADRIVAALEDTAANGETEVERTRAQKILDGAKGVGKGVLTGALVKVLTDGF